MSLALFLYMVDVTNNAAMIAFILLVLMLVHSVLVYAQCDIHNELEKFGPKVRWKNPWYVVLGVFLTVCPSERTMYLMGGAVIAEQIAANPRVIDTTEKLYQAFEKKLDAYLAEAIPEATAEKK